MLNISKDYIKIPSATNLNFPVLDYLSKNYNGDIHISTGMTSSKELEQIIDFLDKEKL